MSIYKSKGGRYAVRIDLDASAKGARRRASIGTYRTRKEAESAERHAIEARDRGIDLSPQKVTVADLLDRFVADRRAKDRAIRTVERYEGVARISIVPHLGALPLAKLAPAHVTQWLATLREHGSARGTALAPKSVKHALTTLSAALRWAVRHDLIGRNVADAVDPPSVPRSQARALDEGEVARILAAAQGTRWKAFFQFALATGARRGELLALRWEDVTLPEVGQASAAIRRAFVEANGGIVEKGTKTNRARTIALGVLGVEALRSQRAMQAQDRLALGEAFTDSGHVFQGAAGGPVAPYLATDAFRYARSRAKITGTLHDLRHTAASWMLAGGIDVASVARILGHTTPATTLGIYAHAMPVSENRAVLVIDERLARAVR